jgi:hypothetical protein
MVVGSCWESKGGLVALLEYGMHAHLLEPVRVTTLVQLLSRHLPPIQNVETQRIDL